MARRPSITQQLNELIERFTPIIRDAFKAAITDIKDRAILAEVIDAISLGDPDRAFRSLGISDAAMRPLTQALEQAFEAGGVMIAGSVPRGVRGGARAVFRFDIRNSRAEAFLRDQSSQLVSRISGEQMTAIRNVITDGVTAGRNPRNIALDIVGRIDPTSGRRVGGIVGLTGPQERAVARARAELLSGDASEMNKWFSRERRDKRFDSTVRKAIDAGEALDVDTVSRLTTRYSDSLLNLRGDNIGRTESVSSLNRSQMEAFEQAVDQGVIQRSAVKRIWDSAGDDGRTRHSHLAMDGQMVGLNEPFVSPSGSRMMFPGDTSLAAEAEETINCRCRVRTEVDWFAGVQ